MKNAILIHGWAFKEDYYGLKWPTESNSHWFPWLSKRLMIKDIHTVAVEMPKPYYPEYEVWQKEFERYDITEDTLLVGHSCGGGFLIRWLSENKGKKVGKVILVAPWVGTDPEQPFDKSFFDFTWDEDIATRTKELVLFESLNDAKSVQKSVEIVKKKLNNLKVIQFENKGHFIIEHMGTEEFPELLQECLK